MRRFMCLAAMVAGPLLAVVGCKPKDESTTAKAAADIPVDVIEADFDTIDKAVKEQKGKVVLIDVWATWCGPCRDAFPGFVGLHKKYADQGLVCVSVSLDKVAPRPKYNKDNVLAFLKSKDAAFRNFVITGGAENLDTEYGLGEGIPFKTLFDKSGKRVWDSEREHLSDSALAKKIETELAK